MLQIFICEDDKEFLTNIQKCVSNYVLMEGLPMSIACATTSPYDVLDYLEGSARATGLYFLDLHLNCNMNGIQLAEKIRSYDPWGIIVFITTDGGAHRLTFEYKLEAMDYIVKGVPDIEARITQCIKNAHAKVTSSNGALVDKLVIKITKDATALQKKSFAPSKDSTVSIDSRDIMYFETSLDAKHNIVMYTKNSQMQFRGSLSEVEKTVDKKRFCRLQRSLIVNLENIEVVDVKKSEILFVNDMVLLVSKSIANKVSKLVKDFHKNGKNVQGGVVVRIIKRLN